jgi:hypothetical protein
METGWYWYKSDAPRDPASDGDWVIVHVDGKRGDVDVADLSFPLSELNGRFVGPIAPPEDLEADRTDRRS